VRKGEREREGGTETETPRDIVTDSMRERQTETERQRAKYGDTERDRDRGRERHIYNQREKERDGRQIDTEGRIRDRQTDRQKGE
jgi:hypothetical protein